MSNSKHSLLEIEGILNNRPLCADYDDDTEDVLTPNYLVFGRRLETSNLRESEHEFEYNEDLNKRESHLNNMINHFWNIWKREYLTSLREGHRCSRSNSTERVNIDDIVIIYDKYQPRHLWKLGRIIELVRGNDAVVRAAKVKTGISGVIITRPLNKLYPLEINNSKSIKDNIEDRSDELEILTRRTKRNAAIVADLKIKYGSD